MVFFFLLFFVSPSSMTWFYKQISHKNETESERGKISVKSIALDLQIKSFFSSSSKISWFPTLFFSTLKADFERLTTAFWTVLQLGTLFSGTVFSMMPIDMSSSPVPCCSVNGFVKIKYDSNKVTAFLAVVICRSTSSQKLHQLNGIHKNW